MGATIALTITANDDGSAVIQNFSVNAVKAFRQAEAASNDAVQRIRNGWSSLKGAWVEIAASIYTLKKAWDSAEMAAQFEEQMGSINRLAAQYNTSAASIVGGIQEVSKGMVSLADAADIAGDLILKRLRPDQIINLASAAETLSNVTGEKVTKSFREMAEAVATGRTKALESVLGVIDLKERYGDLAEKLTEAEKVQAIYNIVMERTRRVQLQLGDSTDTYGDKMERLMTTVKDLNLHLGTFLLRAAAGAIGVFQWLSAGIMAFYSNLVKVVSYGFWVLSKLSITKEARDDAAALYQSLKAEASAMDEGAQDFIGKAMQSFEAAFAKSGDLSAAMKGVSIGTSANPDITKSVGEAVDSQLKMVEGELKAEPPSLDVSIKLNPRLMGEVDKYWDEVEASLKEAATQNEKVNAEFYSATGVITEEYFNYQIAWINAAGEAWKQMGVDAVKVNEWINSEIKKLTEEQKKENKKLWTEGMQDYQAALSAISSGDIAQIAGLFGQYGQIAGMGMEFISNIGNIPELLKSSIKALVDGAKDFGKAIVQIIKEVIVNLPTILTEIITVLVDSMDEIISALIEGIPNFVEALIKAVPFIVAAFVKEIPQIITVLIKEIPNLVWELIKGIWEGIKLIFFGGSLESAVSNWADSTSVTVELDTTEAMNALMYAQDALLGALNDTDRAVAREALLSAREAAILAESASSSSSSSTDSATEEFKGIFGYLGEWLSDLWDTIVGAFDWVWESLVGAFEWFFETLWSGLVWVGNVFSDVFDWAWEGLKDVFNWFVDTLTDLFDWLGDLLSDAWDYIAGGNGENGIADDWFGYGEWWSFHHGGAIKKAHSGLYIGSGLGSQEVPIIAKVGEGILNDYNGMSAIGGEAGLNYANAHGSLPGGASQTFVTQHQYFKVVVDKDGNAIKLTKTQAKNLARTLGPVLEEMQRDGELALA